MEIFFFCRETQENNALLKEEVENMKQKLERNEFRCERLFVLEAENEVRYIQGTQIDINVKCFIKMKLIVLPMILWEFSIPVPVLDTDDRL